MARSNDDVLAAYLQNFPRSTWNQAWSDLSPERLFQPWRSTLLLILIYALCTGHNNNEKFGLCVYDYEAINLTKGVSKHIKS